MKAKIRKMAVAAATLVLLAGCGKVEKQPSQTQQAALDTLKAEVAELSRTALPGWMRDAGHTTSYSPEMDGQADGKGAQAERDEAVAPTQQAAEKNGQTTDTSHAESVVAPAPATPAQTDTPQDGSSVMTGQSEGASPQTEQAESQATEEAATPEVPSTAMATPKPVTTPQLEPAPQPAPEEAPAEDPPTPAEPSTPAYGAIPFSLAEGTGKWWHIDATDSAYWAVAEQINAMRTAGGLEPLAMDETLSATASSRCESFVAGGPFDHSGMVTRSEICASGGPLGSAAAVCAAWQASEAHYANIMEPSFTRMGVSCWFCAEAPMQMTYWTVTLE